MIQMYLTDSLYLNGEQVDENKWVIHLSNGKDITAERHRFNREAVQDSYTWLIDGKLHLRNHDADLCELLKYIAEELTGKYIVFRSEGALPQVDKVSRFEAAERGLEIIYAFPKDAELSLIDGERQEDGSTLITLSNGKTVTSSVVTKDGSTMYNIDGNYFTRVDHAAQYTRRRIIEKLTGQRVIFHRKLDVPEICGAGGAACRAKGECNTAICLDCPIAEQFFADKDGVELIYAV